MKNLQRHLSAGGLFHHLPVARSTGRPTVADVMTTLRRREYSPRWREYATATGDASTPLRDVAQHTSVQTSENLRASAS
jgi:hypothetical protein